MIKELEAKTLAGMFLAGAKNLQAKEEWINELNVFPVPDGDTGTNMTMTIMTAADEVTSIKDLDMKILAKKMASGSLKGARGNSGVILSQLLRGFSKGIEDADKITVEVMKNGFVKGTETAYKAVMKPKEGTILTVAKAMSDKAEKIYKDYTNIEEFFAEILEAGNKMLEYTPELLPVLKEAGVVDSGGAGLMQILQGAYDYMLGKEIDFSEFKKSSKEPAHTTKRAEISTSDIKFGYCTEFIVMLKNPLEDKEKEEFRDYLLSIGDSLVFVADDEIVKVHVHTNHPGQAFEKALEYGELTRMKVDNMREEHREIIAEEGYSVENNKEEVENKEYGFVAVCVGEGMSKIFNDLGVDYVVEGGQTMNPSTQDIVDAITNVHANNVFVYPNNKNIILAASQAKDIVTDKNVVVIPTTTMPQGISALINFDDSIGVDENIDIMKDAISLIKSGEVTYSVRETNINGIEIHKDDIMGIDDTGIKSVGKDVNDTTIDLLEKMIDEEIDVISVYYGKDVTNEMLDDLKSKVNSKFSDYEVEIVEGLQPVYYYIVSVE